MTRMSIVQSAVEAADRQGRRQAVIGRLLLRRQRLARRLIRRDRREQVLLQVEPVSPAIMLDRPPRITRRPEETAAWAWAE